MLWRVASGKKVGHDLAVCNRGSPLFAAGAIIHRLHNKLSLVHFYSATAQKTSTTGPATMRGWPNAVPHAKERRQPTTQYLPTYLPALRRFFSLRRQHHNQTRILPSPVSALYLLRVQERRYHLPRAVPAGTANVPTVPG